MQDFNTEENNQVVTQEYSTDEKTWALVAHLSALVGFIIPFGNIFGPLLVWILKKEELPFVGDQGKEALNFQISVTIYVLISLVLMLLLVGFVLLILVGIFALIMSIIAAINAYDGKQYRYPLTIRFLK